jgi:hypothetical protein
VVKPTGGDNATSPTARATAHFEQLEPRYPLSGAETPVDPLSRLSKVRFNVGDVAGDNYVVKAKLNAVAPVTKTTGAETGIMTSWNRVDVEYLRMEHAKELPVERLAASFRHAFMQIDISKVTIAKGPADKLSMGKNLKAADDALETYANQNFSMKRHAGWILLVSANRYVDEVHTTVIYQGEAYVGDDWIAVPSAKLTSTETAVVAKFYNPARMVGAVPPYPDDREIFTLFDVSHKVKTSQWMYYDVAPNKYFKVENFDSTHPDLEMKLDGYGIKKGDRIKVKIHSHGEEVSVGNGISLPSWKGGKHQSMGLTFVFTAVCPTVDLHRIMVHELTHAFECQHMCGNFNWTTDADHNTCAMCYPRQFMLADDNPPAPRETVHWTQGQVSPELCPEHIKHIREYHLDENTGLDWKNKIP